MDAGRGRVDVREEVGGGGLARFADRSYWIPGSYAPALSKKRNSFLRPLKNKGFKEERMTKVGEYAIDTSTTLESNNSGFTNLSSMPCSDLGCWGSYEDILPSTPRSKHRASVPGCGGSA